MASATALTLGAFGLTGLVGAPSALAAATATASASTGQQITTTITSPASGTRTAASRLDVSGTSTLSAFAPAPQSVVYVIDVSGSTSSPSGLDCNGDGTVSTADDLNDDRSRGGIVDGRVGDTLDCEIGAARAINNSFPAGRDIRVGVQALGGSPDPAQTQVATADMTSGGTDAPFTTYLAGTTPQLDLRTVSGSLVRGQIGQYTPKSLITSTNYEASLRRLGQTMTAATEAGRVKISYFMSDGLPTAGAGSLFLNGFPNTLQLAPSVDPLVAAGIKVNTFGVGNAASTCAANQGNGQPAPLRYIADRTGGTCTLVSNPTLLTAAVTNPVLLDHVDLSVVQGGMTVGSATAPIAMDGSWSATQLPLPRGASTVLASTVTSEGSRATASVDVYGTTAPRVTAPDVSGSEGSDIALGATVVDPDGGSFHYAWSSALPLSDASAASPTVHARQNGDFPFSVTVTDDDGLTGTASGTVHVTNVAPSISASLDPQPAGTGEPATLTVPFTDPGVLDTHTVTVDWGDGTAGTGDVTESGGNGSATATHTYAGSGSYTITVAVRDDVDVSTTQVGNVAVDARPVVQDRTGGAGYSTSEGAPVTLGVNASDADNDALSYSWTPSAELDDATSPTPVLTPRQDGDHPFTVTVSDGRLSSSLTVHAYVVNVAPVVVATFPSSGLAGDALHLSARFTDKGVDDLHTATVDWGDGIVEAVALTEPVGTTPGGLAAEHTYSQGGSYLVRVHVRDELDQGTAVVATSIDSRPTVSAADRTVAEGSSIQLSATAADADGDALTYLWSPASAVSNPTDPSPAFAGLDDAVTPMTVEVSDGRGGSARASFTVRTTNVAPAVGSPSVDGTPHVGSPVSITAAFTDPGTADTHTATVDWGDGTSSAGTVDAAARTVSGSHTYSGSGSYRVQVCVTDDDAGTGCSDRDAAGALITLDRPPVVDAGGPYTVDEGSTITLAGTASDPDPGDSVSVLWTGDTVTPSTSLTGSYTGVDGLTPATPVTLTLTGSDASGQTASSQTTVTVRNVAPTITSVSGPVDPQPIGTSRTVTGSFTDPGVLDTHTVSVAWEDGTTSAGTVDGTAHTFTATHSYGTAGVFNPTITLRDKDGGLATATLQQPVVAYDASAGFVTGGGTFTPRVESGKANIGFNVKYKGGSVPTGSTEFQSKAANLNLKSTGYDWLVVNGSTARYQGKGTVNGGGSYGFQVTVTDGQSTGTADLVRIRIWDAATGVPYYDTQAGSADGAAPTTVLSGGQIKLH